MRVLLKRLKGIVEWWNDTRPGRSLSYYSRAGGALMAGGLAYSALFSLFAALTIGVSAVTTLMGSHQRLQQAVLSSLDSWFPGVIKDGDGKGIVSPDQLTMPVGLGWTSLIAGGVLLFSALSFMSSLRQGLRTMFQLENVAQNPVLSKLRDLGAFVALGLSIVLSSAATLVVSGAAGWFSDVTKVDLGALGGVAVRLVSVVVALAIDALTVAVLFVGLAAARPARKDLLVGAGAAAVALSVVRYLGAGVLASGKSNALLAAFAAVVTLLVWLNLLCRIILMSAAWTANPARQLTEPAPPRPRAHRRRFFRRSGGSRRQGGQGGAAEGSAQ